MAKVTTQSSLISGPKHQPATSLRPYDRDIPQALQDLSQLLPDAPATTDGDQVQDSHALPTEAPTGPVAMELQDPAPDQVERHQQEPSATQPPVVIAPMRYTRTGHQIRRPARFVNAAYHCKHLAQTGIQSVFDSICLPAFGLLHRPWPNQMAIQMQCPSTWHCNNQTVTSLTEFQPQRALSNPNPNG